MEDQNYVDDNASEIRADEAKDNLLEELRTEAESQRRELGQLRSVLSKVREQEEATRRGEHDIQRLQEEVEARREEVRRLRHALLGSEGYNLGVLDAPAFVGTSKPRRATQNTLEANIDNSGELAPEACIRGTWDPLVGKIVDSRRQNRPSSRAFRAGRRSWSPPGKQQGIAGKGTLVRSASTNPLSAPVERPQSPRLNQPPWRPPGHFHADIGEFLCSDPGSRSSSPCRTPPSSRHASPILRQRSTNVERRRSQKDFRKFESGSSPRDQQRQLPEEETIATSPPQRSRSAGSPSRCRSAPRRLPQSPPQTRPTTLAPMDEVRPPQPESLFTSRMSPRRTQELDRKPNQWYDYPEPFGNTPMKTGRLWPSVLSPPPMASSAPQHRLGDRSSSPPPIGAVSLFSSQRVFIKGPPSDGLPVTTTSTPSLSSVPELIRYQSSPQLSLTSGTSSLAVPDISAPAMPNSLVNQNASIVSTPAPRTQIQTARSVYESLVNAASGTATTLNLSNHASRATTLLGNSASSSARFQSVPMLSPVVQTPFLASNVRLPSAPSMQLSGKPIELAQVRI